MRQTTTENTHPEPLTGEQIADFVAEQLGWHRSMFFEHTNLIHWGVARWQTELAEPGWPERFTAAVQTAQQQQWVDSELREALRTGPSALAALSDADMLARIDPKLHRLATELYPMEHGGRLICGPTGTGKTTACVLVFRRHIQRGAEALWEQAVRRKESWLTSTKLPVACGWARALDLPAARLGHGLGEGEAEAITHAKAVPLLVLDDLGWESRRAGADDVIGEVIATRYDAGKVTLVTTGMRPEQVSERYSEAFTRRILEAGGKPGKVIDLWPKESRQ